MRLFLSLGVLLLSVVAHAEVTCGVPKKIENVREDRGGGLKSVVVTFTNGKTVETFPMSESLTTALASKLTVCFEGPFMSRPAQIKSIEL